MVGDLREKRRGEKEKGRKSKGALGGCRGGRRHSNETVVTDHLQLVDSPAKRKVPENDKLRLWSYSQEGDGIDGQIFPISGKRKREMSLKTVHLREGPILGEGVRHQPI